MDNDILVERKKSDESNIRKLNKKNSTLTSMTIRKIKCNNKESVIPLVQKSLKINTSAKKTKKHDGNKEINTLIKNNMPTNDTLMMTTIRRPMLFPTQRTIMMVSINFQLI